MTDQEFDEKRKNIFRKKEDYRGGVDPTPPPSVPLRRSPKTNAVMVQEEIVSGFTIDIDPTNGSVLLDAGELRALSQNNITSELLSNKIVNVMADYVRKHTAKGLDKSSKYYSKAIELANSKS